MKSLYIGLFIAIIVYNMGPFSCPIPDVDYDALSTYSLDNY